MFSFVYYCSMHYFPTMPKCYELMNTGTCEVATCDVIDSGTVYIPRIYIYVYIYIYIYI